MKTRRRVLTLLGAGLLTGPLALLAQKAERVWRVGFLASRTKHDNLATDKLWGQVPRTLKELGYVEGKNLICEWRYASGDYGRLPGLAAELVAANVDVIVTDGTQGIRAAKNATKTIPVVFAGGADLVASGLVKSLSRPEGNATGFSILLSDTAAKQLEFLKTLVPGLARLAVLFNPANEAHGYLLQSVRAAARISGITPLEFGAATPEEIETAFLKASEARVQAVLWVVDSFLILQKRQIASLCIKHRLPSITGHSPYIEAGGLMYYGPDLTELFDGVARYVDKILKGANPGDLPVQQPTKLELVINKKTAKELGLTIPPELLLLADRVIE